MSVTELDPLFVKGLRLLHSKSKDSTDQLKQLLDDVIAQTKQGIHPKDRLYSSIKSEGDSKIHSKKTSRDVTEATSFSSKYEDSRDRKAEKRPAEKIKPDLEMVEAKIPKLESPQVYQAYYPDIPSPDLPQLDQYVTKKDEDTDSSDANADADDFAMEMGLACVICKQLDVTQGNQLIECQECHSLYHQECHRPPATDYDVNDPRRVWYCAKCVKNMKKMTTKTQKPAKSSSTMSLKEVPSPNKSTKAEGSPPAMMLPFKRTELKPTLSQSTTSASPNKPIGLAGLAANFGGRSTSTSSGTLPSARGAKTVSSTPHLKAAFTASTTSSKAAAITSSGPMAKTATTPFQALGLASLASQSTATTTAKTTAPVTKGLGLLSAAIASSSKMAATAVTLSGNGNSGTHKAASFSPLMNADKRLQIMKKKASKMQEKRRLSTK